MNDLTVIGGGIVGLATAYQALRRWPGASVVVIEKETSVGKHQSGHNSGVIHAGVYYAPGSLKARLCAEGAARTREFAAEHGIDHPSVGKQVVATSTLEVDRLRSLQTRAAANGLATTWLDAAELREREPEVVGLASLFVASTGITHYPAICAALATEVERRGGQVRLGQRVVAIRESGGSVRVETMDQGGWREQVGSRRLVACAGLQSDRVASMAGLTPPVRIVPFRGEYYRVRPGRNHLINSLIYPVPDPALPFLGVHLTRTVDGGITLGPNAVLAFAREGYRRSGFAVSDAAALATSPGLGSLVRTHWRAGLREQLDSLSKQRYLDVVRRYAPSLTLDDLQPSPPGIRAQAVTSRGELAEDFVIQRTARMTHVLNAPSPAATSALPIADHILDLAPLSRL